MTSWVRADWGGALASTQVYGFDKQSGGDVRLTSEEGVGTTMHLYRAALRKMRSLLPRRTTGPILTGVVTLSLGERESSIWDPRLHGLYEYWKERSGSRRFPARRDIDPMEVPYILPHIMLIDVLRNPLRFRVRVHGTERVRRANYDLTGKLLDEIPTLEYRNYALQRCMGLIKTAEPTLVHFARELDGRFYRYEAVWLPLSEDGKKVTQLICALVYQN